MGIGYVLLAIGIAEVALSLWFIFGYQRSRSTIFYGLFVFGIAFYVLGNAFGYLGGPVVPNTAEHMGWVGATILTTFFLAFSLSFPLPKASIREIIPLIIWPLGIFLPGFIFTETLIRHYPNIVFGKGYETLPGPMLWSFLIFFAIYWVWSLLNLFSTMAKSDGIHRWQIKNILFGVGISLIVSTSFDVVLPLFTPSHFGYIGSLFSAVWLGFTSYILVKK